MSMKVVLAVSVFAVALPVAAEQHCASDRPASTLAARFVDNGDGTITDRESRLMWTRCSAGQQWSAAGCAGEASSVDWGAAQSLANEVNKRGTYFFSDWRLPQLRELATIVERDCGDPRVNLAVFPGTPGEFYWTASPRAGEPSRARIYALSFGPEGVEAMQRAEANHVRFVRDAR
jgi:hypothetical protein